MRMKTSRTQLILLLPIFILSFCPRGYPCSVLEEKTIFPTKVTEGISIDGKLEEAVWATDPLREPFITYAPNFGEVLPMETWVWAAYDSENLYFAFKCFDDEPDKIKMTVAHRDKITMDDLVGVTLDTINSRQSGCEFYINPKGIQADAVSSAVSVDGLDLSPDFVWDSAAALIPEGYTVEVRIPLKSLKYKQGDKVRMGVIFFRQISRLGMRAVWPESKAGRTMFSFMGTLVYSGIKQGLKLEALPNIAYTRYEDRMDPAAWAKDNGTNIGIGIKYGLTSAMTAEATINPDFSQVESDAFQVEVNQRYPLFYSEKRPFFMESKEVMDFAVVKWGLMPVPIHTRTIVDPRWAAKFSGAAGKMSFALLAADDQSAGRAWDTGLNPYEGKSAFFGVFRAKYNIGGDNSMGILYTGRHLRGQRNDVVGADLNYSLSKNLRASFSFLHSLTRPEEGFSLKKGHSINAMLNYRTAHFFAMAGYELYDRGFSMATAFIQRLGVSRFLAGLGPGFDMRLKSLPWLKRITPYMYYLKLRDLNTLMDDGAWIFGLTFSFAPMGTASFEYYNEQEAWAGRLFKKDYFSGVGEIQLFKWLGLNVMSIIGEAIYYHPTHPFLGQGRTINFGASVQPNDKLNFGLEFLYSDLDEKQTGQRVDKVDIYNLRTTYQFNKYFFIRGIVRYNGFQRRLLTDFLASFTFIPGTVIHLGYGSIYEKNQWVQGRWMPGADRFLEMRRGLIFKVSYLWRVE
jgi:hypothetical protein